MSKIEVFLKGNSITIRETTKRKFPFFIEADAKGSSYITYEEGKYYYNNRLGSELINHRELSPSEVREIIKDVIELKEG